MSDITISLTDIVVVILLVAVAFLWRRQWLFRSRSKGHPLPPGPKRLPVLGNLFDIPQVYAWRKFLEWKKKYGDVVYVEALGNRLLILNSMEATCDLLVKRAAIYSDRPTLVMLGELMDVEKSIPLLQHGPALRHHRKLYHMVMGPDNCKDYLTAQEDAVALFVDGLLRDSKDFWEQTRLMAGRIIMSAVYGIPATTPISMYLQDADEVMKIIGKAAMPGAFMVDMIPALKYLPSWLPYNNIHSIGSEGKKKVHATIEKPFEYVQQQMKKGIGRPSCTAEFIRAYETESGEIGADAENQIKWESGSLYAPGSETTYGVTLVFMHAMALLPGVQQKIQAEIEAVVGNQRLPTVLDRPNLPYLCAAIKEALRWSPVAPLAVPRRTAKDDYYKGYFIPAGTTVLANVWAMSRDDSSGIPPETFSPERFMTGDTSTDALDPHSYVFGFGRRECPGRYLADNSLFLIISWLLATVTIHPATDKKGAAMPIHPHYTNGLISYPESFEVDFRLRNQDLATLLKHRIAEID